MILVATTSCERVAAYFCVLQQSTDCTVEWFSSRFLFHFEKKEHGSFPRYELKKLYKRVDKHAFSSFDESCVSWVWTQQRYKECAV